MYSTFRLSLLPLLVCAALLVPSVTFADVTPLIGYHGHLGASDGEPYNGDVDVNISIHTFNIFDNHKQDDGSNDGSTKHNSLASKTTNPTPITTASTNTTNRGWRVALGWHCIYVSGHTEHPGGGGGGYIL